MEEMDFSLLWKEQYEKVDQLLTINKQLVKEVTRFKLQSALRSLIRFKLFGILAAIVYLAFLGSLLSFAIRHYSSAANYFIVSFAAIFFINVKALYDYIRHLIWTYRINYAESVTETQQELAALQLSIVQHTRFMFLQMPFWTTFYLSDTWFPGHAGWLYIGVRIFVTALFVYLAYWLYKNITIENLNKKWVRTLVNGSGGGQVAKALDFYKEIQQFKQE